MNRLIFYCDTSALNALYDDPLSTNLLRFLSLDERHVVHISAYNVLELGATKDTARRTGLLHMAKALSRGYLPLGTRMEILQRSLQAFAERNKSDVTWSIGERHKGVRVALNAPEQIDEEKRQEILKEKDREESIFRSIHKSLRASLQAVLQNSSNPTPKTSVQFLRDRFERLDQMDDLFQSGFAACGFPEKFRGQTKIVLSEVEPWRFYFGAAALNIFDQDIQPHWKKSRKKKEVGHIDLTQAIYLFGPPGLTFVSEDPRQRKLLRRIVPLGHAKRHVVSYPQFRESIITLLLTEKEYQRTRRKDLE